MIGHSFRNQFLHYACCEGLPLMAFVRWALDTFAGLENLDLLSLEEMKELCPQVAISVAHEAPTSFLGACSWVAAHGKSSYVALTL